jgi:hypothetical protein
MSSVEPQPEPQVAEQPRVTLAPSRSKLFTALTDERKAQFLQILEETGGNVTVATRALGLTRQWAYQWRERDPEFAEEWDNAVEGGTEHLEQRLFTRACDVDTTAAIFLLKARRPEKYRENIKLDTEVSLNDQDVLRLSESLLAGMLEAAQRARAAQTATSSVPQLNPAQDTDKTE